jgi:hypothetical protein
MPSASRNHSVQLGVVGLNSCLPSTRNCTSVQIVSMMKYGSRMSVSTFFICRDPGGVAFEK